MKITLKDGSVFEGTAEEYAELVKLVEGIAEAEDEYVPKVGDKVRALSDSEFRDIKEGEIGEVYDVGVAWEDYDEYSVAVKTEEERCFFRPQDLELVAVEDKEEKPLKDGDYVVALPSADENYSITTTEMQLGKVIAVQDDLIRIGILSHSKSRGFVGEKFFVESNHFRKATEEEKKKYYAKLNKSEFKAGDYARIKLGVKHNGYAGGGDIVKLHDNPGGGYDFKVVKVDGNVNVNYTYFDACDLEKVSGEELKFAKLGRKPGEFKKGDIVRVKWLLGKGYADEIAEIKSGPKGIGCGGNYKLNDGNKETLGEDLELIAPVESRVDLND